MVWTIPLADLAGALAVSFTAGASAPSTPVQRPATSPPTLPDAPPPAEPPTDPLRDASDDPMPPTLPDSGEPPPSDPIAEPPPVATTPPRTPTSEALRDPTTSVSIAPVPASQRLLRPTKHRRFFSLTAGGATPSSIYGAYYGGSGMDFQAELAVGSHGKRRPNVGGAFVLQYRKGFLTELTFAGRVQWDKPLSKAFAIYSTTDLTLGLNLPLGYGGYIYPGIPNAIVTLGWGLKAILAERLMLIFKPVGPGLIAPAYSQIRVSFRWELGGGIGIVW